MSMAGRRSLELAGKIGIDPDALEATVASGSPRVAW
jgi:hypothetical protein